MLFRSVAEADGATIAAAWARARDAQPAWAATPLEARRVTIRRFRTLVVERTEPLARTLTLEVGKPITQARVGDNIRVTLTIVAPNDLHYAVISDPIPAGVEAVNAGLATSQQIGTAPQLRLTDPLSRGWGWWWFSTTELRDDRTVLYATYLPKGSYQYTYTIRGSLAGQYSVIPATGQEAYTPEVYGRSEGAIFTLLPAEQ